MKPKNPSLDDWLNDPWKAATGRSSDLDRWEDEGGAMPHYNVIKILESELDSIGQYVETEGVDWCRGASFALRSTIRLLKEANI